MQPRDRRPSLLVLAAGVGSRFGGTKQLAEVGPHGEAILDYTIFDALDAGFGRVVLVIRRDLEDMIVEHLDRVSPGLDYDLAFQDEDPSVPRRARPWGTAHAVLVARPMLGTGPFAVVNADDLYGHEAITAVGNALRGQHDEHVLVGYELARTLAPTGGHVSRGICSVAGPRAAQPYRLTAISEHTGIHRSRHGSICSDQSEALADDTITSMNLWGFLPSVLDPLEALFRQFLDRNGDDQKAECYLPNSVGTITDAGGTPVRVVPTAADWIGITHADDLPLVRESIRALIDAGVYPHALREHRAAR